jgi:hypothetical protein
MSELQPIIPREENQHGSTTMPPQQDTPEPVPITEQEVGEYREQDRFLPVSFPPPPSRMRESTELTTVHSLLFYIIDCQCIQNYESYCSAYG